MMFEGDNFRTWLSLDEWAAIVGQNRWLLNGIVFEGCGLTNNCQEIWHELPEQTNFLSRSELKLAIYQAEQALVGLTGYNLMPEWSTCERHVPARYYRRDMPNTVYNIRGELKTVQLDKKLFIRGGQQTVSDPVTYTITRVDMDGDTFAECAYITVPDDFSCDCYRLYYQGLAPHNSWEIRGHRRDGNKIYIPLWNLLLREYVTDNCPDAPYEGTGSIYETEVDLVCFGATDTTDHVTYYFANGCGCYSETCGNCAYAGGCISTTDPNCGIITYGNGCLGEPDWFCVNYQSGWQYGATPCMTLDPYWATTIAYLAAAFLTNDECPFCEDGSRRLVNRWTEELNMISSSSSYQLSRNLIENQLGVWTRGAFLATRRAIARNVC